MNNPEGGGASRPKIEQPATERNPELDLSDVPVEEVSREDGRTMLDQAAREYLGISGASFLRDWRAGRYADHDNPDVAKVALLVPFAG